MVDMPKSSSGSPFLGDIEVITESDEELRAILRHAELAPLLPTLAYISGDLSLLREDLRPDPLLFSLPGAGLTDEQADRIRGLALDTLVAFRDGGCRSAPAPADDDVLRIMEFAVGGAEMREYLPLLEEELGHRGEDHRAPTWRKDELAPEIPFTVAVIGAGLSGIATAHRLQQAGLDYVVFEKNPDVGGTWYENSYPGCRVDNPNHNYSYSFAQRHDWPLHYSTQPVLQAYARDCAEAFDVMDHIRFRTEVTAAEWSDEQLRWTLTVRSADGTEETHVVDAVVSAVGQLNRPNLPSTIPGFGTFEGPAFHSARWDHDVELAGKRVAVIGSGASAMQFVPEIAPEVAELLVFQRTPAWMGPSPDYHDEVSEELRWLYRHVPSYAEWNRFCIFWRLGDGAIAGVEVDPAWDGGGESVSAINDFLRQMFVAYIDEQFADRPDLREACTPHYPPGAKRIIRDDGSWPAALTRDNVRLLDGGGIRAITPRGIVTADGTEEVVDVIIYGTGFAASKFLTPMTVKGRGGLDLHEHWAGDARAYLGVTIPSFPNLFCLYGPNTNIVINGSIIYFSECGVRYILGLIALALAAGHRAVDVRRDVHDEFNVRVDAENDRMSWGAAHVNSWYKNEHGRVAQNWPFTLLEYWQWTLAPRPEEYDLLG
jgi:4-hydroxyacetophenone monooxygenase